jgi:hypothetical protein
VYSLVVLSWLAVHGFAGLSVSGGNRLTPGEAAGSGYRGIARRTSLQGSCAGALRDKSFSVETARPPERWADFTELLHRYGSFPIMVGSLAVCGSSLLHHREAAAGPFAVRRLERVKVAHSQSSGEAVSPASAVGLRRYA